MQTTSRPSLLCNRCPSQAGRSIKVSYRGRGRPPPCLVSSRRAQLHSRRYRAAGADVIWNKGLVHKDLHLLKVHQQNVNSAVSLRIMLLTNSAAGVFKLT